MPDSVTRETAASDLATVQQAMQHVAVEQLAVALDRLLAFAEEFDNKPWTLATRKTITREYRAVLQDLPADLVDAAVTGVTGQHRYGRPKPGDLTAAVSDELRSRRLLLSKLEAAARRLDRKQPPGWLSADHETRKAMAQAVLDGERQPGIKVSRMITFGYLKPAGDHFAPGPKMVE